MKGNVKKIFAAVLAIALVVSVVGCGKKTTGYLEDGTYELIWYNEETKHPDHDLVYEELNKYTKEKIGVTVNYTPIAAAEYAEKMQLLFASGERVDMCFSGTSANFHANARQSAYMDMTEVLNTVGKPTKDLIADYALACFNVGGKQYGIPVLKDWAFQPCIAGQYKVLEEVGLNEEAKATTSLEEWTPILAAVKAKHPDYYGILMRGNHNMFKFNEIEMISGAVVAGFDFDDYSTVVNAFNTDKAKDFFKLMRSWYQAGYIRNDAATATDDKAIIKVGNYVATHGEYLPYLDIKATEEDTNSTVWATNLTGHRLLSPNTSACGLSLPRTCADPEKTMEFVNLIYTDKYVRNLLAYGIENKHWIADGDTHYKLPEGCRVAKDTGYASSISVVGNRFLLRVAPNVPDDIWEKYQEFNESAFISPAIGFVFDATPVSGQIAAVQNVYQEYFPSLVVGAVDPEVKLPEFINKLNSVGAEEIIAEVQRQYDEWKKNK